MPITGDNIDVTDEELQELVDCIRLHMRDYAINNVLLQDVQFDDADVRKAINLAVSEYNALPPESSISWRALPDALLILGVGRWLMLSESYLQIRNQVSVQTDGLGVVGIDDKQQQYIQTMQMLRKDFKQGIRDLKTARNLAGGYGTLSSGYANVSRFHHN